MNQTPEEIAAGVKTGGGDEEKTELAPRKRVPLQYEFEVDHTTPNGDRYQGKFKNRILSVAEYIQVSRVKAGLTGGLPLDAVDPGTVSMCEMVAHLLVSLEEKPVWFDTTKIHDLGVLEAVYEEVAAHQNRFRGVDGGPSEAGGGDPGGS